MASAAEYLRPPIMDAVVRPGVPVVPVGNGNDELMPVGSSMMFNAVAMGAVATFELIFVQWRRYKRLSQQEQQQQYDVNMNRLAIQQYSPGHFSEGANASSLAFNYEQLDIQEAQQQSFPQLLAELRELRQQIREQQQVFNEQLEQQKQQHRQHMQRLQLGMDERDQRKNEQMHLMETQLKDRQTTIDEQRQQLEQTKQTTNKKMRDEQEVDP